MAETADIRQYYPCGENAQRRKSRVDKVYGNDKLMPIIAALGAESAMILT